MLAVALRFGRLVPARMPGSLLAPGVGNRVLLAWIHGGRSKNKCKISALAAKGRWSEVMAQAKLIGRENLTKRQAHFVLEAAKWEQDPDEAVLTLQHINRMGWEISDDERDRQRTFHIGALARADRATDAWHTSHEYMQAGFRPGARTVQQVVCALARKRHDRMVLRFLKTLRGTGFKLDVKGYNIVLKACSMADSLEIALELYHQMVHVDRTEPNVRTYDSLLRCCCHHKEWRVALRLFAEMRRRGVVPDALVWTKLLETLTKCRQHDLVLRRFSDMQAAGAVPPARAYGPVLMACIMTRNDARFHELTRELSHAEWTSATELSNFYSRLVEGFVATGQLRAAVRILDGVAAAGRLSSRIVLPVLVHYARVLRDVAAVRGIMDAMRAHGARLSLAAWDMAVDTAWTVGNRRTACEWYAEACAASALNPYRLARPGVEPGRPMWTTETPPLSMCCT
eukprot:TRINITY_DN10209_c0_g1_i1.p1 TRINITY_DN10209_c0_g1~~TRINITY_DN10209_c0_g1_i1.p1  ORF type:complete len:456 (-),score=92.37 TRINITY_DN10209_c0_g1_i1:157-1524(-)